MNIDNLISKYLDGELSESEDLKLRNIISTNENSRDIFNTYIDLHIATKEDAKSIETPEDIRSETEDRVLMAIMDATAKPAKVSGGLNIFNLLPKQFASMVAVLLLISFTYTSDLNFFKQAKTSYDKQEMVMEIPTVKAKERTPNLSTDNDKQEIIKSIANNISSEEKTTGSIEILESTPSQSYSSIIQTDKTDSVDELFSSEDEVIDNTTEEKYNVIVPNVSLFNSNATSNNMQFGQINDRVRPTQNNLAVNNIQLTAFSASPYTVFGFDDAAEASVHSYSQAISISINEKTRVGLEIGYSDIAYLGEMYTTTNILDRYGRETGQQLTIRTESDKDYALYWGQMFFQSELVKIENFDLGLRLGFGLSEGGFNTNSKALASYEVLEGIKLTAGTEFSYFTVSLPQLINGYTENYYSFSMIYGLQFSF